MIGFNGYVVWLCVVGCLVGWVCWLCICVLYGLVGCGWLVGWVGIMVGLWVCVSNYI